MRLYNILKYFFGEKLGQFWQKSNAKKVLAVLTFFAITILILFSNFSPQQVMLRTDEVATRDITSNINTVVIDEQQTAELKRQAAEKVQKAYQEDKYALDDVKNEISNFYVDLEVLLATEENPEETEKTDSFEQKVNTEDRDKAINDLLKGIIARKSKSLDADLSSLTAYLANTNTEDRLQMKQVSLSLAENMMAKLITEEAMDEVYKELNQKVDNLGFAADAEKVIQILLANVLKPNLIYNQEATEKAIKEAQDMVQPVQKSIGKGQSIVREGDRVTAEQISILEQMGIQRTRSYPITLLGTALFVLITFWLTMEFLRRYHKDIYKNDMLMLLIGIIFIIIILLTRIFTIVEIGNRPEVNALTGFLAPVAAGSMLIAILLDSRLAYFLTIIMSLYVGLLSEGNQLTFTIVAFFGGIVGVYRVSHLSQTTDLAKSGLYIAGVNIATIITLTLINGNVVLNTVLLGILLGAISGILSAVFMIGALPYLETGFSITSMIKLLELSNPNHDLLKRLLIEAPGTYHHSLMVGNLAEASAEFIGANPLLVRVGAYYHDIGKIKRPEYFVENQRGFNPHEKIAPALSALIITSHVKEGIELAREARLPQVIIDFIAEHHGTGLAKYFYSRALEEEGGGNISEDSFRYEGPKPQSKEIALVMLADSVEAAVRSLPEPGIDSIHEMVRKIIRDKLNDGQLEECDLTFKDLDVIASTFCTVLEGVYHKRIEYPDNIVRELAQRREYYGYDGNKPAGQS